MWYLCLIDGAVEYASNDPSQFAHYQLIYAEDHADAEPVYLTMTDEEYDDLFGSCDDE